MEGGDYIEKQSYKRFSEEQVNRANSIDVAQLAKLRGYPVVEKGKEARIKDMGGMVIDKQRNRWYRFSQNVGGGPIQFLMEFENMTWKEAVESLLNEEGELEYAHTSSNSNVEHEKKPFKLPEKNNTYKHIFAYLVKTRYIHPSIVQEFVDKKLLYENKHNSCVFVGTDPDGKARYASIRGTYTAPGRDAFKGEATGSDKRYGFSRVGRGKVLFVAEAPIDVLSYLSIYKNHNRQELIKDEHLLALGCTADNALEQYLLDHPEITDIKLGLDNDEAGNEGCKKIYVKYSGQYNIRRIQMNQKDMNEVLKKDFQSILAKTRSVNQEIERQEELEY